MYVSAKQTEKKTVCACVCVCVCVIMREWVGAEKEVVEKVEVKTE